MGSRRPGYYQPREDWDVPVLQQVNSQLEMYLKSLPGGSELSLSELQDMASRQQLQIDNQQQVLVAKEQRLKYLKQQEMKHAQMSAENERLRKLKEKVESQEMKLKKLRALRGQVEQYKMNNGNLTSELEGIKSLFNEKEKELAMAVAKVEELTSQLEMLRSGKAVNFDPNNSPAALELEKLRKELMLRNKLNEQQNANIVAHREMLGQRRDEISQMDRRISDLQQRLKKKKAQQGVGPNYSLNNNNNFMGNKTVTRNGGTNVAAVEPYIKHAPKDVTKDDLHTNYSFERQDPKHQTLPPNLKFPYPEKGRVIENNGDSIKNNNQTNGSAESAKDYNVPLVVTVDSSKTPLNGVQESSGDLSKPGHVSRPSHSQALPSQPPQPNKYSAPSTRAGMGIANFTPKPFGSTYSTSMLSGRPFTPGTSQPVVSAGGEVRTGGSGQSSPATSDNGLPVSIQSQHSQHSHVSSPSDSSSHPSKPVYSTAKLNYGGPSHSGVSYPQPSAPALSRDSKSSTVPLKPGNSAYSHPAVSVSERGPTLPPRQSSTSSNSSITPFSQSSKHPMQTPLQRPSQRVPTTPPTSVTSAAPTTLSDSSSPPKPSSNSGAPVPSTSSSRQGHSAAQSVLSNHRWPRSSADTRTSPANPLSSTATTTAPSRGRLLSGNTNPPVSNGPVNVPTSSPNGGATAKPETTQASVTSALNALLQPGAAGQNLRGPRYASKSVIANTYTRKLGSGAMEQYRKNMSKLYQGFGEQGQTKSPEQPSSDNKSTESGKASGSESSEQKSPVSGDVVDSSHPARTGHPQPHGAASKPHHHSGLNSNSTLSQYTSDKPSFKAMSPKHLRRRHSDSSDNEEVQLKLPQKRAEATPASKSLTQPSETLPGVSESSAGASSSESVHVPDRLLIDNLGNVLEVSDGTDLSVTSAQNEVFGQSSEDQVTPKAPVVIETNKVKRRLKTNLKSKSSSSKSPNRRVSFDPLALLLDASLEGELDLVRRVAKEVADVSASNDEGITALHNAICAGHYDIVKYLVEFGSDANAPDSDGWTPLHCAASCNNLPMVKLLVEHGACIFATTISDHETAAEKCEEDEDGYDGCSEYLYSIQEKLGIINNGVVFAVFDYKSQNADELSFRVNSQITVLRKGDDKEKEWWWSRIRDREGYVPRNLLGLSRRVIPDRGKP